MKKITFVVFIFLLSSCSIDFLKKEVNNKKASVSSEVIISEEGKIASGTIEKELKLNSSGSKLEEISKGKNKLIQEEKDVVIIKENQDIDSKTQQEVINEMEDYVNDLFNMIEEDVK